MALEVFEVLLEQLFDDRLIHKLPFPVPHVLGAFELVEHVIALVDFVEGVLEFLLIPIGLAGVVGMLGRHGGGYFAVHGRKNLLSFKILSHF